MTFGTLNVWSNPKGYQRTSRKLQYEYLSRLLSAFPPEGDVLDVGSGTGNAVDSIDPAKVGSYLGIDISAEMVEFAKDRHKGSHWVKFLNEDFKSESVAFLEAFDHVICAACLHWFYPQQDMIVQKIKRALRPGGILHLSCAARFNLLEEEDAQQRQVLRDVRSIYEPAGAEDTFSSRRIGFEELEKITSGFEVLGASFFERPLHFENREDFKDWHLGSGSVVANQFIEQDRRNAEDMYYDLLYKKYDAGALHVSYATHLITLRRGA